MSPKTAKIFQRDKNLVNGSKIIHKFKYFIMNNK